MSAQHTLGPWTATGSAANYTPPGDRSDRSEMMDWSSGVEAVAPFTENEHGGFERVETQQVARGFGRTAEEAKRNARLIATVPDLLACLERYVAYDRYINGGTAQKIERYREAIAVIAKATENAS